MIPEIFLRILEKSKTYGRKREEKISSHESKNINARELSSLLTHNNKHNIALH